MILTLASSYQSWFAASRMSSARLANRGMKSASRPQHKRAKARTHHTQALPKQLSRAFAEARDEAKIGGDNPPTFHEIRSLGGALLQESE